MIIDRRAAMSEIISRTGRTLRVVDISDMLVSDRPDDALVTYSLGSCIGLVLYDPAATVGGMLHCMLPLSKMDRIRAKSRPCMFADTGVQALLQAMFARGAQRKNLIAKIAGGGSPLEDKCNFRIGERNYTVVRKVLWKNNILIDAEDVGGAAPRTMYLHLADGRTIIRSRGRRSDL